LKIGKQNNSFECSIPEEIFPCFLSFMNIFKGSSFCFDKFDFEDVLQLINCFGLNSLCQFIHEKIPFPENLVQALDFLSHSYSLNFEQQFNHSIQILIKNFDSLTIDNFTSLPNFILNKIFLSPKLIVEDEDYLFIFITKLTENNTQRKELMKAIKFEFVSKDLLKSFFENFSINKFLLNFFNHFYQVYFVQFCLRSLIHYQNDGKLNQKYQSEFKI
jgi:hypothetical protein